MRSSQFNLLTSFEETGEALLFNTANGALAAFPSSQLEAIQAFLDGDVSTPLPPGTAANLELGGFTAGSGIDEVEAVLERVAMGIKDNNRLDVFILPNMNCNFECPYCYEDHRVSQISAETEHSIMLWFERVAPLFKVVLVSWFGGEPLLSHDRIVRMQTKITELCDSHGISCNAHITTNGYLLDEKRADALVRSGVRSYQITVDGPPDVHNASRVLKGPGDSFERVFANLCSLAENHDSTNIKLRVNFDAETLQRVPELLEMIPVRVRPRMHLVLERIFGQERLFVSKSPRRLAMDTEQMYALAADMGFAVTTTPLEPGKLTYCYADRENQFLFTHIGDVFKCTVSKFESADRLGALTTEGRIQWEDGRYDEWMNVAVVDDECRSCTYLPMCMGGCRKNRYQRGHASSDCTLPFAALDERVRHRYAQSINT